MITTDSSLDFIKEKDLLIPVTTQRGTPMYSSTQTYKSMYQQIHCNNFFNRRIKNMATDLEKANTKIDDYVDNLSTNIEKLVNKEKTFVEATKRISTNIRKNAENMTTGISRIKQAANFNELERYTEVLERLVGALDALSIIESKGKLDKVIAAIK